MSSRFTAMRLGINLADACAMVSAKWRRSKSLVFGVLVNLTVGLCVLAIFLNIGVNSGRFINATFLSDEDLQQVLVLSKSQEHLPINMPVFEDSRVVDSRIVVDSDSSVLTVDDIDYSGVIDLDITVLHADELLFENEYAPDGVFVEEAEDWRSGVLVSEKSLALFPPESLLGKPVAFEVSGVRYTLPVSGVVFAEAEENFDYSYKSFTYVLTSALNVEPTHFETAELKINDISNVSGIISEYSSNVYALVADTDEIDRINQLSKLVSSLLLLSGLIMTSLSVVGMRSSLRYLEFDNSRYRSLLLVIGFDRRQVMVIDLVEAALLSIASSISAVALSIASLYALKTISPHYIATDTSLALFGVNHSLIGIVFISAILLVFFGKYLILKLPPADSALEDLRDGGRP